MVAAPDSTGRALRFDRQYLATCRQDVRAEHDGAKGHGPQPGSRPNGSRRGRADAWQRVRESPRSAIEGVAPCAFDEAPNELERRIDGRSVPAVPTPRPMTARRRDASTSVRSAWPNRRGRDPSKLGPSSLERPYPGEPFRHGHAPDQAEEVRHDGLFDLDGPVDPSNDIALRLRPAQSLLLADKPMRASIATPRWPACHRPSPERRFPAVLHRGSGHPPSRPARVRPGRRGTDGPPGRPHRQRQGAH